MSKKLVAERDGVMLKVGNEIRQLYRDGAVPDGADEAHVKLLVERGLLVEADATEPDADNDGYPVNGTDEEVDAWVARTNVSGVLEYVDAHPDSADAVLASEKRGKARTSIIDKLSGGS